MNIICSSKDSNWKNILLDVLNNSSDIFSIKYYYCNNSCKRIDEETEFYVELNNNDLAICVKQNESNIWKCSFSEFVDELYNIHDFEILNKCK